MPFPHMQGNLTLVTLAVLMSLFILLLVLGHYVATQPLSSEAQLKEQAVTAVSEQWTAGGGACHQHPDLCFLRKILHNLLRTRRVALHRFSTIGNSRF